jgi:putative addiction module component (TIGR02574 family)
MHQPCGAGTIYYPLEISVGTKNVPTLLTGILLRETLQAASAFFEKGYNARMNNISIADILELPVQERIRLVELIWDSVAAVPEAVEISPALKAELEARLAEFEANPEAGYSWDQVKSRLKDGSWRTV